MLPLLGEHLVHALPGAPEDVQARRLAREAIGIRKETALWGLAGVSELIHQLPVGEGREIAAAELIMGIDDRKRLTEGSPLDQGDGVLDDLPGNDARKDLRRRHLPRQFVFAGLDARLIPLEIGHQREIVGMTQDTLLGHPIGKCAQRDPFWDV